MKNEYWNRDRQRDNLKEARTRGKYKKTQARKAAMVKNTNGIHKIHKIYKF